MLWEVVPLGLAAAVTPGLIGLQLLVVVGPTWSRRALAVFLANLIGFSLVAAVLLAGLMHLPDTLGSFKVGSDGTLRLILAAGLLIAAAFLFWPHPVLEARVRAGVERHEQHAPVKAFFFLALYFSVTDVSSFAVLAPGLHDVSSSSAATVIRIGALLVLMILALAGTWAAPIVRLVAGHRADSKLSAIYDWVMNNQFHIMAVLCLVFGVYFLYTGLQRL